jgi:hypothetical protein
LNAKNLNSSSRSRFGNELNLFNQDIEERKILIYSFKTLFAMLFEGGLFILLNQKAASIEIHR